MTRKNGDTPAMPLDGDAELQSAFNRSETYGLTKREYFAALAMQGLLASLTPDDSFSPAELARSAVLNTDALLAELERTK